MIYVQSIFLFLTNNYLVVDINDKNSIILYFYNVHNNMLINYN